MKRRKRGTEGRQKKDNGERIKDQGWDDIMKKGWRNKETLEKKSDRCRLGWKLEVEERDGTMVRAE